MDPQHYKFALEDLAIDTGDIERLMGHEPGTSPEPFPGIIQDVYSKLPGYASPEGGFIILDGPELDLQGNQTGIGGISFLTERIVTRMLRKSEKLALFVGTAGPGIEAWAKELNGSMDLVTGFVVDAFGSQVAEATSIKLHSLIKELVEQEGDNITNRYSPGYCDWLVKDQQKLFSFFPENFSGITLSETSLMQPIKSISGIIGIGPKVRFQQYICDTCKDEQCVYRRLRQTEPQPRS